MTKIITVFEKSFWRENSNCKQTAENINKQLTEDWKKAP